MRKLLSLILVFLLLSSTAAAREMYERDDVTNVNFEAPNGYVISTVNLDNIESGFNSTIVLDSFGEEYLLSVNGTKRSIWWNFYVTLQYPNGTIETSHLKKHELIGDQADIKIQYFYTDWGELVEFDVNVFVGILPLTASFTNPVSSESVIGEALEPTGLTYTRLPFSDVQASCNQPFDFEAIFVTPEQFKGQIAEDVWEFLYGSADLFFGWAWKSVLAFASKIPVIGPYLEITLVVAGLIFSEISFYFNLLIVENWYIFFMAVETWILGDAILNTKTFFGLLKRTVKNHVEAIKFALFIFDQLIELWTKLVTTIAQIVQAFKPT